jgi:hypothetical protein
MLIGLALLGLVAGAACTAAQAETPTSWTMTGPGGKEVE